MPHQLTQFTTNARTIFGQVYPRIFVLRFNQLTCSWYTGFPDIIHFAIYPMDWRSILFNILSKLQEFVPKTARGTNNYFLLVECPRCKTSQRICSPKKKLKN